MLLIGDLGADLHSIFILHLLEPLKAWCADTLEGSGMGAGLPYSRAENMDAEFVKAFGGHHHLQLRLGAARTGDNERGNALVEKSPLGDGDDVKCTFHNYLKIFLILFASWMSSVIRPPS